jgi:RHS repeat-associated protein
VKGVLVQVCREKVCCSSGSKSRPGSYPQKREANGTWDLDQQRTHNDANEITQIEGSSALIAHDRAGNMTTIPRPGDNSDDYALTWDAWNRLVKVEDGADTVAEYEYDGSNRRAVKKTYTAGSLDQTRHFYYTDQWQCVEERTESGGAIAANPDVQYVWGDRYVDDLILRDCDTTANGTLDERLYALHDANWNVTALAEADGDVVERFSYTAYGAVTVLDGDFSSDADGASDYDWQYTYTTRRLDEETGLMYYRNRMYHAELGRFISRDPISFNDGPNVYGYTSAMPLDAVDPTGLRRIIREWEEELKRRNAVLVRQDRSERWKALGEPTYEFDFDGNCDCIKTTVLSQEIRVSRLWKETRTYIKSPAALLQSLDRAIALRDRLYELRREITTQSRSVQIAQNMASQYDWGCRLVCMTTSKVSPPCVSCTAISGVLSAAATRAQDVLDSLNADYRSTTKVFGNEMDEFRRLRGLYDAGFLTDQSKLYELTEWKDSGWFRTGVMKVEKETVDDLKCFGF